MILTLFPIYRTRKWKVFTGNELGALLGWWSFECYKQLNPNVNFSDCYTLASTVSSKILKAIANVEGFQFIETLTGFKWMGEFEYFLSTPNKNLIEKLCLGNKSCELMAAGKSIVFAFEEAIGFMVSPTVLDKDGVSAACHLASLGSYLRHSNLSFNDKLIEIYNKYGYHYTVNSYFICREPEVISAIFTKIRNHGIGDKVRLYKQEVTSTLFMVLLHRISFISFVVKEFYGLRNVHFIANIFVCFFFRILLLSAKCLLS